jgi:hypothetical protein
MEDVISIQPERLFVAQPYPIMVKANPDDETHPVSIPLAPAAMMANAISDLDLPAFMRRRDRYSTEA